MLISDFTTGGDLQIARLGACSLKDATYKTINGHSLLASIVVPRGLAPGKHPLVVRWHGGGLVNGHRLYTPWIAQYMIEFLHTSKAIMVLHDYRLLPGASGLDILEDMNDFFAWIFNGGMDRHLETGISADLSDVLVSGESAGGWLAIQSALTQRTLRIKAIVAHYPMIDMRDVHWNVPDSRKYLGGAPQKKPRDLARFFSQQEETITYRMPPDGGEIYHCLVRQGLYGKFFGTNRCLYPLEVMEDVCSEIPCLSLIDIDKNLRSNRSLRSGSYTVLVTLLCHLLVP
jgi:acetyl esterase/lipase